jgi:hypothetical protein
MRNGEDGHMSRVHTRTKFGGGAVVAATDGDVIRLVLDAVLD